MCVNNEKIVGKLTIFGMDIENFSVVCDKAAPVGVLTAIEDFKKYILEATGVQLNNADYVEQENQIVIGIDNCDTDKCNTAKEQVEYDGFAIVGEGNKLFITAKVYYGVAFGIYAFLEEYLGVRFYSSSYTIIRPAEKIDIPSDVYLVSNPKFNYRNIYWTDVKEPNEKNKQFPVALRDNTFDVASFGDINWYVDGSSISAHSIVELAEMEFAVGRQPCLTDEKVFQTVLKNARKWLEENPKTKILSISQNDSWAHQYGCQCDNCRAIDEREETYMGSLLAFVNRIADELKEDYPDLLIETLAYRYTRKPPKTIVPQDNVIIRLCSIECCFCHPFDYSLCESNANFKRDIDGWSKIAKNLYIWDYTTNFHKYMLPFPNLKILHKNMKFFADHNVTGIFAQGNAQSLSAEFGELRAYLIAKLLWNPYMSEQEYFALMDEFLCDYYGAGWENIRKYIDWTSDFSARKIHSHCETSMLAIPFDNKEQCQQMIDLWREAERKAETDIQKEHVRISMVQILSLAEHFPQFKYDFREEIYKTLKRNGITHYRVNAPVPELKDGDDFPSLK